MREDLVARYGKEELGTVLPATDVQNAVRIAKNIQREGEPFKFVRAKSDASNFLTSASALPA